MTRVSKPTYRDGLLDGGAPTATLAVRLAKAISALRSEAAQLDTWARESHEGGWSTHQVGPMQQRADDLRRLADELETP